LRASRSDRAVRRAHRRRASAPSGTWRRRWSSATDCPSRAQALRPSDDLRAKALDGASRGGRRRTARPRSTWRASTGMPSPGVSGGRRRRNAGTHGSGRTGLRGDQLGTGWREQGRVARRVPTEGRDLVTPPKV
jgi:hypothetical protein